MHSQLPTPKVSSWPPRSLHGLRGPQPIAHLPAGRGSGLWLRSPSLSCLRTLFPPSVLSETSSPNSFLSSSSENLPRIIHCSPTSFWNHLPEPPSCPSLQAVVLCSLQLSSGAQSPPNLLGARLGAPLHSKHFIFHPSLRHLSGVTVAASMLAPSSPAKPAAISFMPRVVFSCPSISPGPFPLQGSKLPEGQGSDLSTLE